MKRNCSFIILIILLLTLTYTFSSTVTITEPFHNTIKSSFRKKRRGVRQNLDKFRDGFTQMKSFFS